MSVCDLTDKTCKPCEGGVAPLDMEQANSLLAELHKDWSIDATG
jgi:4a-hydroxytetrahydrobiopterin dehydratase